MGFIDLDEFIVLKKHKYITDLLESLKPEDGGLTLNWFFFHYNNQLEYKALPVTKRFQRRENDINQHVKAIGKTKKIREIDGNPHNLIYNFKAKSVDTDGQTVEGPFNENGP